jgi:hypothetical protein
MKYPLHSLKTTVFERFIVAAAARMIWVDQAKQRLFCTYETHTNNQHQKTQFSPWKYAKYGAVDRVNG